MPTCSAVQPRLVWKHTEVTNLQDEVERPAEVSLDGPGLGIEQPQVSMHITCNQDGESFVARGPHPRVLIERQVCRRTKSPLAAGSGAAPRDRLSAADMRLARHLSGRARARRTSKVSSHREDTD